MNDKIQLLLQFIKKNPDLPVIPMVYYEVVDRIRKSLKIGSSEETERGKRILEEIFEEREI